MSNQALPQKSRQFAEKNIDRCRHLGLILDKLAPWGQGDRGGWDLTMRGTIRRGGQNQIQTLTGGEAKGLWLSTGRRALNGETPSLFETDRTDTVLMQARQDRWLEVVKEAQGVAFTMRTVERFAAGLGASHVLETALTLDRNTGLPYLPGSSVKGLARAWGLIEVAAQLDVSLCNLNQLSDDLMKEEVNIATSSDDARAYIDWFRFIFGWQGEAGAVSFLDAIYAGETAPQYAADVMTPHYVKYYTDNGGNPPAEDDNPNPVSFITVDKGNTFAFGIIPRHAAFKPSQPDKDPVNTLNIAVDWLVEAVSRLGAGSKTAAGYGFFSKKSANVIHHPSP